MLWRHKFGFDDVIDVVNWQRKLPAFEESTASTRENRRFSRVWGLSQRQRKKIADFLESGLAYHLGIT